MAKAAIAERREPLAGEKLANKYVTIEAAAAASRISLRASEAGTKSFEKGLGFKLPRKPKTSASKGGKHALWLGPDEWIIINEDDVDLVVLNNFQQREIGLIIRFRIDHDPSSRGQGNENRGDGKGERPLRFWR